MSDLNRVTIIGRITWDPELKYTAKGTAVLSLNLACNKKRKKQDEVVDAVSFFTVILYGKMAETLTPFLVKGKCIGVDGELRQRRWDYDGRIRSVVEIIASEIQLLSYSNRNNAQPAAADNNYDQSLAGLEDKL